MSNDVTDPRVITRSSTPASHRKSRPSDLIECIETGNIIVTVAEYGWVSYIRQESATEYAVRFENEAGALSGTLTLDRREVRRLLIEKVCEAVWIDVRDGSRWPADEQTEVMRP